MSNVLVAVLIGIFVLVGILFGRAFCGRICPYGILQDLIHKIPFPKKIRSFKADKYLRYLKYVILLFMIVSYLFTGSTPGGEQTNALNIPTIIGFAVFVLLCIVTSRPFCKYICPVGAVNGLFNLLPTNRYTVDQDSCTKCGVCASVCKMDIEPYKSVNSVECVRCGKCKKKCPSKAITSGVVKNNSKNVLVNK